MLKSPLRNSATAERLTSIPAAFLDAGVRNVVEYLAFVFYEPNFYPINGTWHHMLLRLRLPQPILRRKARTAKTSLWLFSNSYIGRAFAYTAWGRNAKLTTTRAWYSNCLLRSLCDTGVALKLRSVYKSIRHHVRSPLGLICDRSLFVRWNLLTFSPSRSSNHKTTPVRCCKGPNVEVACAGLQAASRRHASLLVHEIKTTI